MTTRKTQKMQDTDGLVVYKTSWPYPCSRTIENRGTNGWVAQQWSQGKAGKSKNGNFWTDGLTLWSYNTEIGFTANNGAKVAVGYFRYSISTTSHIREANYYADYRCAANPNWRMHSWMPSKRAMYHPAAKEADWNLMVQMDADTSAYRLSEMKSDDQIMVKDVPEDYALLSDDEFAIFAESYLDSWERETYHGAFVKVVDGDYADALAFATSVPYVVVYTTRPAYFRNRR